LHVYEILAAGVLKEVDAIRDAAPAWQGVDLTVDATE